MILTTANAVRGMVPRPTDPTFAQFCRDGVEFMLQKHDTQRPVDRHGGWDAYLRVSDVHAFLEQAHHGTECRTDCGDRVWVSRVRGG